jgi:hypothetical protein
MNFAIIRERGAPLLCKSYYIDYYIFIFAPPGYGTPLYKYGTVPKAQAIPGGIFFYFPSIIIFKRTGSLSHHKS